MLVVVGGKGKLQRSGSEDQRGQGQVSAIGRGILQYKGWLRGADPRGQNH